MIKTDLTHSSRLTEWDGRKGRARLWTYNFWSKTIKQISDTVQIEKLNKLLKFLKIVAVFCIISVSLKYTLYLHVCGRS